MEQRHFVGKATLSKVEHDLVWVLEIKDRIFRWLGYDDQHWWDNYSVKSFYKRIVIGNETYEIDFETSSVYLVVSAVNKDDEYEIRRNLKIG